jgi:cobalt-zinc-cadmium efflux system membrane fusion protein
MTGTGSARRDPHRRCDALSNAPALGRGILAMALMVAAMGPACGQAEGGESASRQPGDGRLELSAEALDNAQLSYAEAGPADLAARFARSGDMSFDRTRLAMLVSRVSGVVKEIKVREGDRVKAGAVVALISSRKLADLKLAYLRGVQRFALVQRLYRREKKLHDRGISTKDAYLRRKKDLEEAGLELHLSQQRLMVVGVDPGQVRVGGSGSASASALSRYPVRAPFGGTVLAVKVTVGSAVTDAQPVVRLADLSRVWAEVRVPVHRIAGVQAGQKVPVENRRAGLQGEGKVIYVSAEADRATRTVLVRLAVPNPGGRWRPGISVTARFRGKAQRVAVAVPRSAVHEVGGHSVVFVKTGERRFEVRRVWPGRKGAKRVAIRKGLRTGERVATGNSFALKAEYQNREGG